MKIKELRGANMDIDLVSENLDWNQDNCPWNKAENTAQNSYRLHNAISWNKFCSF